MNKLSSSDIRSATTAVSSSFIYGILAGTPKMSSLLFVASMARYNIDRQMASFPFLFCYTVGNGFGPLFGYLGGKFGLKNVIIFGCLLSSIAVGGCFFAEDIITITVFWGVTLGFGVGMSTVLLPQVLSLHFSSHLDKAIGITVGGECIASFLLTFLTEYLLKTYGVSGTFLILCGIVLHSIPFAMLIQIPNNINQNISQNKVSLNKCKKEKDNGKCNITEKLEQKMDQNGYTSNNVSNIISSNKQDINSKSPMYGFRVFLNPTYILIFVSQGTLLFIYTSINTILVDVSRDHGVSVDDAVYILIGFQAADAIGRFTLGFITDNRYLTKSHFAALCFASISLLLVAFIWLRGFGGLMVFVLGFGIFVGGLKMIGPSFVMQYVEKDCLSIALASRSTFYSPISFSQAPLIGFFRDRLKNYNGLICILIAICCMNVIVSLVVPLTERLRQKRKNCLQDKQDAS